MTRPLTIGSLFSGIGGLELGLSKALHAQIKWQCEIDAWCRHVLRVHYQCDIFEDITTLENPPKVDILCGGFPCQDISSAGKMAGLSGKRSGLWREYARIIRQTKPKAVVVENVASNAEAWLPTVRSDMRLLGYDSIAIKISAFDCGAPHLRERVFVVATDPNKIKKWLLAGETESAAQAADASGIPPKPVGNGKAWAVSKLGVWAPWDAQGPTVPTICPVFDGLPDTNRWLEAAGNAVVPACAFAIGLALRDILGPMDNVHYA